MSIYYYYYYYYYYYNVHEHNPIPESLIPEPIHKPL